VCRPIICDDVVQIVEAPNFACELGMSASWRLQLHRATIVGGPIRAPQRTVTTSQPRRDRISILLIIKYVFAFVFCVLSFVS
jgi:hypothetical protein